MKTKHIHPLVALAAAITTVAGCKPAAHQAQVPSEHHCPRVIQTNGDWIVTTGWDAANQCHARWLRHIGTNQSDPDYVKILFDWQRLDPSPLDDPQRPEPVMKLAIPPEWWPQIGERVSTTFGSSTGAFLTTITRVVNMGNRTGSGLLVYGEGLPGVDAGWVKPAP